MYVVEMIPAAQFLTLRLTLADSTDVSRVDLDGPGHAPPYLCVRRIRLMRIKIIVTLATSILIIVGGIWFMYDDTNGEWLIWLETQRKSACLIYLQQDKSN